MDLKITVALIAGGFSLVTALLSAGLSILNWRATRKLEREKAELQKNLAKTTADLQNLNADRNARRDYEYDARKRLYEEIEPLLFQLYEAAERAYYSVIGWARTARAGKLDPGPDNWLAGEGYYLHSSIHRLLMPVALLRIIQRRMTFIDLDVDDAISAKYQLLKIYAWSFTDDFDLAQLAPALDYKPNDPDWPTLSQIDPAVYRRQGLTVGDIDNAADALLKPEGDKLRAMSFGEFRKVMKQSWAGRAGLEEPILLYRNFSPTGSPVLSRMLLAQGCILRLLMDSYASETGSSAMRRLRSFLRTEEFLKTFSWSDDAEVSANDAEAVRIYIEKQLVRIPGWAEKAEPSSR